MFGSLHAKYIKATPAYLRTAGFPQQAEIIEGNMDWMMQAVQSPDADYSQYVIPVDKLPDALKFLGGTSPIKWEHVYPVDFPAVFTAALQTLSVDVLKIPYRYADVAILEWWKKAVDLWETDQKQSLWHIGRACHLVEDVSVPMHVAVTGNLKDCFDVFAKREPNHNKYEMYCETVYSPIVNIGALVPITDLPGMIKQVATETSKFVGMASGFTLPAFISRFTPKFILQKIMKTYNDNYEKAANYSNSSAQRYTVSLLHAFFKEVGV